MKIEKHIWGRPNERCISLGRVFVLILSIFLLIYFVALGSFFMIDNQIYSDTGAWMDRAYASSNITEIRQNLEQCREGMTSHGLDYGYDAWFFKNNENNMIEVMADLDEFIERVKGFEGKDYTMIEYQLALERIHTDVENFGLHYDVYWKNHDPALWWFSSTGPVWLMILAFGLIPPTIEKYLMLETKEER